MIVVSVREIDTRGRDLAVAPLRLPDNRREVQREPRVDQHPVPPPLAIVQKIDIDESEGEYFPSPGSFLATPSQ